MQIRGGGGMREMFSQVGPPQGSLHSLDSPLVLTLLSCLLVRAVFQLLQAALELLQLALQHVLLLPQVLHLHSVVLCSLECCCPSLSAPAGCAADADG